MYFKMVPFLLPWLEMQEHFSSIYCWNLAELLEVNLTIVRPSTRMGSSWSLRLALSTLSLQYSINHRSELHTPAVVPDQWWFAPGTVLLSHDSLCPLVSWIWGGQWFALCYRISHGSEKSCWLACLAFYLLGWSDDFQTPYLWNWKGKSPPRTWY